MGKFSTGMIAGAVLGVGMLFLDKRTVRKAKRSVKNMMHQRWM